VGPVAVSVNEVKNTIFEGIESFDEAESTIVATRDRVNSAHTSAAATTRDSSHPDVQRGLSALKSADHEAELLLRRIHASTAAAKRFIASIG
jgi:hypothetical protein